MLRLATALREEGMLVDVVAPSGAGLPGIATFEGIPIRRYRYAPRAWETIAYTGTMSAQMRRSWRARAAVGGLLVGSLATALRAGPKPDIVHAHWWFPGGLVGGWLATLFRRPLVVTLHGSDIHSVEGIIGGRRLLAHVLRRAHQVTTVSTWLADAVRAVAPDVRPLVAPMPVATDLFFAGRETREDNRVLFVGKLNEQKGIIPFLEAFARLNTSATADIVVGVGSEVAPSRQIAERLGIADRLRWHPLLAQQSLADLYRQATVLGMPAVNEGLGLVAIEAQLSETPVVAFSSGGLTDTVIDGETGFLVPTGDVGAFARALEHVLTSPARARELGHAGRLHALQRFAPDAVAGRYADLYRALDQARHAKS